MKSNSELDEMKNSVMQLEMSVSKLAKEKVELIQNRDAAVRKCKLEVKQLEQELIDAKMESACFKSRLQEQQNKINRLKKQQQKAQEPKEGEGDTFVKIKEENPLVNPSNKMKSSQNSQNYVDHLMKMNDQKAGITGEEEKQIDMENEDWDSKDDNVINEGDGESSDSNGDGNEDLYRGISESIRILKGGL